MSVSLSHTTVEQYKASRKRAPEHLASGLRPVFNRIQAGVVKAPVQGDPVGLVHAAGVLVDRTPGISAGDLDPANGPESDTFFLKTSS